MLQDSIVVEFPATAESARSTPTSSGAGLSNLGWRGRE
jgi:hypothetical protein